MPTLLCHNALRSALPEPPGGSAALPWGRAALLRSSCRVSSHLSSPYTLALGLDAFFQKPFQFAKYMELGHLIKKR